MPTVAHAEDAALPIELLVDRLDHAAREIDIDRLDFLAFANIFLPEAFHHLLPDCPTSCPPGSPEKKEIMRLRIQRGQSPCHPEDCDEPSRVAKPGRKGGGSPLEERKGDRHRAVVGRIRAGSFRTARAAAAAAQAASAAARQAIQEAQAADR